MAKATTAKSNGARTISASTESVARILERERDPLIERHAAEEKAYFQQRCAEVTLACSGDAVIISDSAQRVTHLNGPAELLTGWSAAEARGHSLNEILGEAACDKQA